jgi:hypothetical protein
MMLVVDIAGMFLNRNPCESRGPEVLEQFNFLGPCCPRGDYENSPSIAKTAW